LSDDFAVLDAGGQVLPFPRRVNLTDESLALLGLEPNPNGIRLAGFGGREKWLVDIDELFENRLADASPVGSAFILGPVIDASGGDESSGDEDETGAEATWLLQLDHLPEGIIESLVDIPGVRSAELDGDAHPPVVRLLVEPGMHVVTDLDAVCAFYDVAVLAARRRRGSGEATASGSEPKRDSGPARRFDREPAATPLSRQEAIPELLARSLSLSGRRFLAGTSEAEVLRAIAVVQGAIVSKGVPVYRLESGDLGATADLVERVTDSSA
jgi:hypothetical protein